MAATRHRLRRRWLVALMALGVVTLSAGVGVVVFGNPFGRVTDNPSPDADPGRANPVASAVATPNQPATADASPNPAPTPDPGTLGACGDASTTAVRELRGMWLTTVNNIDFPSQPGLSQEQVKAEYLAWLDLAQSRHHNAIFVHVRPSGDAFWPSDYAPWSQWLTGRMDGWDPGWDPLAFMVEAAHARGLEFHAWFNPYRATGRPSQGGAGADWSKLAPDHPLLAHPEWAVEYPLNDTAEGILYFDPGNPEARVFVEDAILEAVTKYDLDGVHLDDYFYPYPSGGQDFGDAASFAQYGSGDKADWRRDNVNTFVRELDERIHALKPWVKFGISPFGIWRNSTAVGGAGTSGLDAYETIYADARLWVEQGWVDYIVPQLYWEIGFDKADYAVLLPWWASLTAATGVHLYVGQADYRVGESGAWSDPAELSRHLALGRGYGVQGNVHFSAKDVRADRLGAQSLYGADFYGAPALVPVVEGLPVTPPPAPQGVAATASGDVVTLTWSAAEGAARYAVYRVEGETAPLVGLAGETTFTGPAGTYCVAALDRNWAEGPASAPVTP